MNTSSILLKNENWNKLSLVEQLANIGSEVERAIIWKSKKQDYSRLAFFRALELLECTINDTKNKPRLKELVRVYEVLCDYFIGENKYNSSDRLWHKYFFPFNFAARKNH